jgi:hypothetical protein
VGLLRWDDQGGVYKLEGSRWVSQVWVVKRLGCSSRGVQVGVL